MLQKIAVLASALAIASLLAPSAASASPAQLLSSSTIHSGPGANYAVIGHAEAGQFIDVINCLRLWCEVSVGPTHGFIAQHHIAPVPPAAETGPENRILVPHPLSRPEAQPPRQLSPG